MRDGGPRDHRAHGGFPEAPSVSSGSAGKGLNALGPHSQPMFVGCPVFSNVCLET